MLPIVGDIIGSTLGKVVEGGIEIIKRYVPDRAAQLQAEAEIRSAALQAEIALRQQEHEERLQQIEVNKLEAASADPYVRRARPTIMWICAAGMGYFFILHPLLQWALSFACAFWWQAANIVPPELPNVEYLLAMLGAILGLGGYRSFEKWKGVAR